MYRFAFYYTDLHRSSLDQFTNAQDIEAYLDDQDLMPQFITYAKDKGVQPDYNDIKISRPILQKTIKAYVARNIIDNDGFFPIIADIDQTLKVAVDTIATL